MVAKREREKERDREIISARYKNPRQIPRPRSLCHSPFAMANRSALLALVLGALYAMTPAHGYGAGRGLMAQAEDDGAGLLRRASVLRQDFLARAREEEERIKEEVTSEVSRAKYFIWN